MDLELLRTKLNALQSTPWPFELELRPELPTEELISYYRDSEFRRSSGRPCRLIEQYSFVDPRGRLDPCLSIEMGNVFETPFEEVWNGERYRAFRRLIRRERRLPLCERCPA